MHIERRLTQLGLVLPAALRMPPAVDVPSTWVRVYGEHAYVPGLAGLEAAPPVVRAA
jgi:hypothetical protein